VLGAPTIDAPRNQAPQRVALGRVVGAHALKGEVRVRWLGDGPEHLLDATALWLGSDPDGVAGRPVQVSGVRTGRPGELLLRLEGVADRDAAEALRGGYLTAEARALPTLPEGEHYWFELVGCRVEDTHGEPLGTVTEIWETGAHDVLVIEGTDGRRRLVPTADDLLKEVDSDGRRIVIEVIPGLLDPV
jgi:16S rRNA processing protein RimM